MKVVVNANPKSKTFSISKSYAPLREKEINVVDPKFYQKVFIVLISLSTFLIFPESPQDLGNICEIYNSKKLCKIW